MELAIDDIKIGKRHRKDFGDIDGLALSIERLGLLHPIVVNPDNELIVGERRIKACKKLKWDKIPARVVKNLSELQRALEAEKDENTCRKDFSPEEVVLLGTALEEWERKAAKERQREGQERGRDVEHGKLVSGKLPQTKSKTRDVVGKAAGVSGRTYEKAKAVVASGDRQLIDEMNRTGKVNGAAKALKDKKKLEELKKKADAIATMKSEQPLWTLIQADVCDGLQSVIDNHGPARLIFTDPPYNIGIDYGKGKKADSLPENEFLKWCAKWIGLCRECLTDDGSFWLMIGDEYADQFGILLRKAGFNRRAWIKWYETFGVNCSNNFNRTSRHIFYCVMDEKKFVFNPDAVNRPSDRQVKYNDKRTPAYANGQKIWDDVWCIPRIVGTAAERVPGFPTQLPLELVRAVVGCASEPGDLVVDPFNGSGTTGVAALEGKRKYIGIDSSEKFIDIADLRLKGVE